MERKKTYDELKMEVVWLTEQEVFLQTSNESDDDETMTDPWGE